TGTNAESRPSKLRSLWILPTDVFLLSHRKRKSFKPTGLRQEKRAHVRLNRAAVMIPGRTRVSGIDALREAWSGQSCPMGTTPETRSSKALVMLYSGMK